MTSLTLSVATSHNDLTIAPEAIRVRVTERLLQGLEQSALALDQLQAREFNGNIELFGVDAELVYDEEDEDESARMSADATLLLTQRGAVFHFEESQNPSEFAESRSIPPLALAATIRRLLALETLPATEREAAARAAIDELNATPMEQYYRRLSPIEIEGVPSDSNDRKVFVNVMAICSPTDRDDVSVPGRYTVIVTDPEIPQVDLAGAAIDIFHSQQGIGCLDDFIIWTEDAAGNQIEESDADTSFGHAGFVDCAEALEIPDGDKLQGLVAQQHEFLSVQRWAREVSKGEGQGYLDWLRSNLEEVAEDCSLEASATPTMA